MSHSDTVEIMCPVCGVVNETHRLGCLTHISLSTKACAYTKPDSED